MIPCALVAPAAAEGPRTAQWMCCIVSNLCLNPRCWACCGPTSDTNICAGRRGAPSPGVWARHGPLPRHNPTSTCNPRLAPVKLKSTLVVILRSNLAGTNWSYAQMTGSNHYPMGGLNVSKAFHECKDRFEWKGIPSSPELMLPSAFPRLWDKWH